MPIKFRKLGTNVFRIRKFSSIDTEFFLRKNIRYQFYLVGVRECQKLIMQDFNFLEF